MPIDLGPPRSSRGIPERDASWADDPRNTVWGVLAMLIILAIGGVILYAPLTGQQLAGRDRTIASNAPKQ
jgi:hypothetical protein